jgi:hypothetical protein
MKLLCLHLHRSYLVIKFHARVSGFLPGYETSYLRTRVPSAHSNICNILLCLVVYVNRILVTEVKILLACKLCFLLIKEASILQTNIIKISMLDLLISCTQSFEYLSKIFFRFLCFDFLVGCFFPLEIVIANFSALC